MATVRNGSQSVMVVVDVQVGVVAAAWDALRVVANVARAVERARAEGVPVVWVQHADADLPSGSPNWAWAPPLVPAEGEAVIAKSFNSSFEETDLGATLERLGATHVVLAGAATNWCIRATAHGALDRGYDLTLVADAHTTEDLEYPDGVTIAAPDVVRELNTAMKWMSFPGRTNTAVPVEEVAFAGSRGAAP